MAFEAEYILYDGISSERFGLRLFNENGGLDTTSGSSFSILRSSMQGGLQYVYLGREDREPISLTFSMVSEHPIDAAMQGAIHRWLIGKGGYRELRILQPDMTPLFVGCIFHEIQYIQNGNETVGIEVTGECDSCYFRGNDRHIIMYGSNTMEIVNYCDANEYIYPEMVVHFPSGGGSFTLVNDTDNGRSFELSNIGGDEIITVDNARKIIISSKDIRRLSDFNKKWFRLLPGKNQISCSFLSTGGSVEFIIPVYRMVGQ